MPKQVPRYDLAVQRRAVEQVIHHRRPIAEVARQTSPVQAIAACLLAHSSRASFDIAMHTGTIALQ